MFTSKLDLAFAYANSLHAQQKRKCETETPYIGHLMAVAALVIENSGTEDAVIAALLHDAVEDQGGTEVLESIKKRFGENVAMIVEGCTDSYVTDPKKKEDWKTRKERYIAGLSNCENPSILLVSCADKLHNLRSTFIELKAMVEYREFPKFLTGKDAMELQARIDKFWSKFKTGRDGQRWYYSALLEIYMKRHLDWSTRQSDGLLALAYQLKAVMSATFVNDVIWRA